MTAKEIRDQNFTSLRATLDERRREVLFALAQHDPCTTRQLALLSHRDVLSVRPRITELKDLGLVVLDGRDAGEGIYRCADQDEWQTWHTRLVEEHTSGQMQLV